MLHASGHKICTGAWVYGESNNITNPAINIELVCYLLLCIRARSSYEVVKDVGLFSIWPILPLQDGSTTADCDVWIFHIP